MRLRPFYYKADGGGAGGTTTSVIDDTFGPLSTIRPNLAAEEAREGERKQDGKAPKRALETGAPLLDSQRDPGDGIPSVVEGGNEPKTPEAARKTPPADGETESGSDHESPDDESAALDALVDKYQGKPRSMAKAIQGLRSLQTRTAEEKKALEDQVSAAAEVIDRDFDWIDGKPVLKAEVAARSLRNGSGRSRGPFAMPTEAEVRASVTAEFKEDAADLFEEDQIPSYLAKMRPRIDKLTAERFTTAKAQVEAQRYNMLAEVGNVVERHLREHPEDKSIMGEVDKLYANIPEEIRAAAVLEEWMPFGQMAELVRIKSSLPQIAKDAFELGKKHRGESGKVTEPGTPGKSRPAPTNGRGSDSDAVQAMKAGVLRGSGLPSLDELFS